jgi:M6 family metalloprotease-like protein
MSRSSHLVALPLLALLAAAGRSTGAQRESREADLAPLNAPETAAATERGESLVGRVETIVVDEPTGHGARARRFVADDGRAFALDLPSGTAEPESGSSVSVSGVVVGGHITASSVRMLGKSQSPPSCAAVGQQQIAVLLVTLPGTPAPSLAKTDVADAFFGASGSLDSWLREVSYGKTSATGDVFGWYTLDASYACDRYEDLRTAAIAAADRDVDFRKYSRIFIVIAGETGCSWTGIGTMGCAPLSSQRDGSFTSSTSWVLAGAFTGQPGASVPLLAHEIGHNLGLAHAATRRFAGEALGPLGAQGTIDEYNDPFSAMSAASPGHYASPHKSALGWVAAGVNAVTVETTGTYTLQAFETQPSGVQVLKVRRGTGNDAWLWISYRQPIGTDGVFPPEPFAGAILHYEDAYTGGQSQLLDFTPSTQTFYDPALGGGATWTDPYSNLSITVGAASSSGLDVSVAYGAASCVTGAPTVTVTSPNPTVAPGASATYSVSVKSNDSAACKSAVFALSSAVPSGFASSLSPSSLSLAPGASGAATLTVTPGASATPGTYTISVLASAGTSGSGGASCTVTEAGTLAASLVAPSIPYTRLDTVPISATVLLAGNPAVGAAVQFTMTKPNGTTATSTQTTGSSGKAVWNYRVGPRDPKGTYTITATASFSGQSTSASGASFDVQ